MTRRDRIVYYVGIRDAAKRAAAVRATGPVRLPVDIAGRLDAFLVAADAVVAVVEQEIVALESARDWP